jgi:hypothetical protein
MALTFDLADKGWEADRISIGFESLARSWSHWYHDLPPASYPQLVTVFEAMDLLIGQVDHPRPLMCPFRGTLLLAHAEAVHETIRLLVEEDDLAHPMDLPDLGLIYEEWVADPNVARLEKLLTSWSPSSEPIPLLPTLQPEPTTSLLPHPHPSCPHPQTLVPIQLGHRVPLEFYSDYLFWVPAFAKLKVKETFNPLPCYANSKSAYFVCLGLRSLIYFWSEYFHDLPGSSREKAALIYSEARLDHALHGLVAINRSHPYSRELRDLLRLALAQAYMDWAEIMDSFEVDENGDYPEERNDLCDDGLYITCLLHNLDPTAKPADWFVAATGFTYL